jgi:hypothetical protein
MPMSGRFKHVDETTGVPRKSQEGTIMALTDHPHAELPAGVLADWLEQHSDRWWTVDGDPLLGGLLDLPAPGDELAEQVRRVGRPLWVGLPSGPPEVRNPIRTPEELTPFVQRWEHYSYPDEWLERLLYLKWQDKPEEWLLIEDSATTEGEARDAAAYGEGT